VKGFIFYRVCQIGFRDNPPTIRIYKDRNEQQQDFVSHQPHYPHEAVSKNYVDRKFDTLSFLSYEGHIPPLERAHSKTGFIVNSSSRSDLFHQAWTAFNSGSHGEWVTAGEGKDAWIQISCPSPVRIWKIRLASRRSNRERITSWKLCVVTGERFTDFYHIRSYDARVSD